MGKHGYAVKPLTWTLVQDDCNSTRYVDWTCCIQDCSIFLNKEKLIISTGNLHLSVDMEYED